VYLKIFTSKFRLWITPVIRAKTVLLRHKTRSRLLYKNGYRIIGVKPMAKIVL